MELDLESSQIFNQSKYIFKIKDVLNTLIYVHLTF